MISWFITTITTSAVAQGVIAGAVATAPLAIIMWMVKDLPRKIFRAITSFLRKELTLLSTMEDYEELVHHLTPYVKWTREKTLMNGNTVTLGYGTHYGIYKGTFFKLIKSIVESDSTYDFKEKSEIYFYERKDKSIEKFVFNAVSSKKRKLKVYHNGSHGWDCAGPLNPRSMETIYFSGKNKVVDHIKHFNEQEKIYEARGMPYHTGVLLYGSPGTGKTSVIKALGNYFKKDLYVLNPAALRDGTLPDLFGGNWKHKILVLEDIDVSGAAIDRSAEKSKSTLSELLNVLDGISTPHGMITIATTNNIERLDPALIRPGRFDLVIEVGAMEEADAQKMAEAFGQKLTDYTPMTGAQLRQELLKNSS